MKGPASGTKHSSVTARLALEEVASARDCPDVLCARARLLVASRREQGRQAKDVSLGINSRVSRK